MKQTSFCGVIDEKSCCRQRVNNPNFKVILHTLFCTSQVLGVLLDILYFFSLNLRAILWLKVTKSFHTLALKSLKHCYSYYTDGKTEAQRDWVVCPRPMRVWLSWDWKPSPSDSKLTLFPSVCIPHENLAQWSDSTFLGVKVSSLIAAPEQTF